MKLTMDPVDLAALELQKLVGRGLADPDQVLVRIDYRREANDAPFQFDMLKGRLHRNGCPTIPVTGLATLYAVWDPGSELQRVACGVCRPARVEAPDMSQDRTLDVLYGLISIVDQFGSVLKERGKEYRASTKGQKLSEDLNGMFSVLDETQQDALRVVLDSLDGLVKVIELAKENSEVNGKAAPTASHSGNRQKQNGRS